MEEIEAFQIALEEHAQKNEELRKTNEELRKSLHRHDRRSSKERSLNLSARDNPKPFSQEIMDESMPPHYITPKIAFFTRIEDPEIHLTTFNAQMIISGGSDAIRCKMFMGNFIGKTLQWFSGIPDGQITSFPQFSKMFREQFPVNKVKPPRLYDLFSVRQREGETRKDYLNRF